MTRLAEIYTLLRQPMPSFKVDYEFNLLLAHILEKQSDFSGAISAAETAVYQIRNSGRLSDADRKYLLYYAKVLMEYCSDSGAVTASVTDIDVKFGDLLLNSVSNHLQSKFPVDQPQHHSGEMRLI